MNSLREKDNSALLFSVAYLAGLLEKGAGHKLELSHNEREELKGIFSLLLEYFKHLTSKEKAFLHQRDTQMGLQSLMLMIEEILQQEKTDAQETIADKIKNVKEYQELIEFYTGKVAPHIGSKRPFQEWEIAAEEDFTSQASRGLDDLNTVRLDTDYELFLLRSKEGRPLFTKKLLHALKLTGAIEEVFQEKEDQGGALKKPVLLQEKEVHKNARQMVEAISPHMDRFYQDSLKKKLPEGLSYLSSAVMALMLAANPRNLIGNALGKSCLSYYKDFDFYLRKVLLSGEYEQLVKLPSDKITPLIHSFLSICEICSQGIWMGDLHLKEFALWLESFSQKKEKGVKTLKDKLLTEDTAIRKTLEHYSNQPLLKAAALFQAKRAMSGFNCLNEGNFPGLLYTITGEDLHLSLLKVPSPTVQEYVSSAHILPEFSSFLRTLKKGDLPRKHLLINLQDKTSWKELARAEALEKLSSGEELIVITLANSGEFYHQIGEFSDLKDASSFLKTFENQLENQKSSGYFFDKSQEKNLKFKELLNSIHQHCFGKKAVLNREERLLFIDLFYLDLSWHLIEIYHPDSLSFTCKDAVDFSAAMSAELFAFLKFTQGKSFSDEDYKMLLSLLYKNSFQIRGRALLKPVFQRALAVISFLEQHGKALSSRILSKIQVS